MLDTSITDQSTGAIELKKVLLTLALMLMLSVLASAENDSAVTGPYMVSFDLGIPKSAYNVSISPPKESESLSREKSIEYSLKITNESGLGRFAVIGIMRYEQDKSLPTGSDLANIINSVMIDWFDAGNIEVAAHKIDGADGEVGSGDVLISGISYKTFMAEFLPVIDRKHLMVYIDSSFPWDEGTLQLLKTIHVEKVK